MKLLGVTWKRTILAIIRVFINSFILSKFGYYNRVLPIAKVLADEAQRAYNRFLWTGSMEKMALQQTCLPVKEGGLGVLYLHLSAGIQLAKETWRTMNSQTANAVTLRKWMGRSLEVK